MKTQTFKKAKLLCLSIIFSGLLLLGACSKSNTDPNLGVSDQDGKIQIVATTTMLADLSRIIGGDFVEVEGLMGPGIDPHLYQASAGDVTALQKADIVVYNGLHLEGKMGTIFESLTEMGKKIIRAEDALDRNDLLSDEEDPIYFDPHIWFDVSLWKDVTKHFAEKMAEYDPDNASTYSSNAEKYLEELDEAETYIKNRIGELPEESRVLVTAHDAFQYFAHAYGFEVRGLQGISTDAEAGTADVRELADFIIERKIKAIFIESSVPHKNVEALQAAVQARGFDVEIGGELYSDSLGDQASGHDSYIETIKANVDTIVDALK